MWHTKVNMSSIADSVEMALVDSNMWNSWERVGGPVLLLTGLGVCVIVLWITGNMVGDVSCSYRLSYSPGNGAFSIWGIIFPWFFVSVFFQLIYNFDMVSFYVAKFESNVMMCIAWISSGMWSFFFGLKDSPDPSSGIGFATFFLVLAATSALTAVFVENGFQKTSSVGQILTVSIPFSIYASWLCVAASINIGIFVKSTSTTPLCERNDNGEPIIPDAVGFETYVPILLSIMISVVGISRQDFIVTLPLVWAIAFMKLDAWKIASLVVLTLSFGTSCFLFFRSRIV